MASLQAEASSVQQTFSSWDACMSKAYCKWPVIIAIIVGSLIALSIITCIARCLCRGAECCGCCLRCCCPGRRSRGTGGYNNNNNAPPPMLYQQYPQYSGPVPPTYNPQPSPYRGPTTATFDAPTKTPHYNEDALPSMPSWDNAATRRVEEEHVEMDRLDAHDSQQQHLLAGQDQQTRYSQQGHTYGDQYGQQNASPVYSGQHEQGYGQQSHYNNQYDNQYGQQQHAHGGDMGNMSAAPYHDYSQHQQYAPSMSPVSTMYAPSTTVPPSYHTRPPSMVSPSPAQYATAGHNIERRPVQGSYRVV